MIADVLIALSGAVIYLGLGVLFSGLFHCEWSGYEDDMKPWQQHTALALFWPIVLVSLALYHACVLTNRYIGGTAAKINRGLRQAKSDRR